MCVGKFRVIWILIIFFIVSQPFNSDFRPTILKILQPNELIWVRKSFRIDNTDHIIDVNKNNLPFEYDQVNIICPVYPHSNQGTRTTQDEQSTNHNQQQPQDDDDDESERYIIYNVSKEEYDSCRITNPNPRIIAVCDKPNQLMYFTITFRSFTPQPGGLEFLPGHDYYFVSTSTGDLKGLHQRVGGRCATHNMKVIFKVCCSPTKGGSASGSNPPSHQPSTVNASLPATSVPVFNSSERPLASTLVALPVTTVPRFSRPTQPVRPYELPIEDEMDRSPPADKNKEDPVEKVPKRDRATNDGLVNTACLLPLPHRWFGHHGAYFFCVTTLCLVIYHWLMCR